MPLYGDIYWAFVFLVVLIYTVVNVNPSTVWHCFPLLSSLSPPPPPTFSAFPHKHIQYTDTTTQADTGTSVLMFHYVTQASFIGWPGKRLHHCRCSAWVGAETPFSWPFPFCPFMNIIRRSGWLQNVGCFSSLRVGCFSTPFTLFSAWCHAGKKNFNVPHCKYQ